MRALLEGRSVRNTIRGAWASVYEAYVAVVTAATLLLKLDAQVHDQMSSGTFLRGLSSSLELVIPVIKVQNVTYFA